MPFTLAEAKLLSPKTLRNEIVQDFEQIPDRDDVVSVNDVFPTYEMSNASESFFRRHGGIAPMRATGLTSESPITDIESLIEEDINVETYKQKTSPEKGVTSELNSEREIMNLYQQSVQELRQRITVTREKICWQGDGEVDGMIGPDGASAHPSIESSHVFTPATAYDDHENSNPKRDLQEAEYRVDEDGLALNEAGPVTAYMSPSTLFDLRQNAAMTEDYRGVQPTVLTEDQITGLLPFDVRKVRTKVPRQDAEGNLIDEDGNLVTEPRDAKYDNVLEPYDPAADRQRRNILIGASGANSAFMPWYATRLAEHASNAPPSGQFSVDSQFGILTQTWTEHDPAVSWLKVAQEIGFHVTRPENWVIVQDI